MMLHKATVKNVSRAFKEVKSFDEEGSFEFVVRDALKNVLEDGMELERTEYLEVEDYQRSKERFDFRNGYYERDLLTQFGNIRLSVPRVRKGNFSTKLLAAYQRRTKSLDEAIKSAYFLGVSSRKVENAFMPLVGEGISAATVSRLTKSLDEQVKEFHNRRLSDNYSYLFLDGIVLKERGAVKTVKKVILCAYGVKPDGKRELIDFMPASSESQVHWEAFLNDLFKRGLLGKNLKLVITDGGKGLHAALDAVYPRVPRQRCWFHKLSNVVNYLKKKDIDGCIAEARRIYNASNYREAVSRYWEWAKKWRNIAPKAVECLERDLDDLLTFFTCEPKHRKMIRTTNAIERIFKEVKRRTKPIGVFNNVKSLERIVFAVITHLNHKWKNKPLTNFTHN